MRSFIFIAPVALRAPAALRAQTAGLQVGVSSFNGHAEPGVGVRVGPASSDVLGLEFSLDIYPRFLAAFTAAGRWTSRSQGACGWARS